MRFGLGIPQSIRSLLSYNKRQEKEDMDKLDKNKIDELLPRYCEGQVTEEERLLVETWMNESEENRRVVKQIHSLYLANEESRYGKSVVEGKRQDNR